MLSVDFPSVSAKDAHLLENITLRLEPGHSLGVTGPSGCGKTTLLRAMAGLIDCIGGTVTLDGDPPGAIGWPAYRRRVALVSQRPVLFDASVRANLARPFAYRSAGGAEFPASHAQELIGAVGLAGRMDQNARSLSEGEQQRVCLVRAMLVRPQYLLLDEPTSALDVDRVAAVEDVLRAHVRTHGAGIICVTHSREQAERLCDSVMDLSRHIARAPHA